MKLTDTLQAVLSRFKVNWNGELPLSINIDHGLEITFSTPAMTRDGLIIEGKVMDRADNGKEDSRHIRQLLRHSLGIMGTTRECLSVNPANNQLVLYRIVTSADSDLESVLESFLNNLETWQKVAMKMQSEQSDTANVASNMIFP